MRCTQLTRQTVAVLIVVLVLSAGQSRASGDPTAIFTGQSGDLKTEVDFILKGDGFLTVDLFNTASVATSHNGDVLTGLFFNASNIFLTDASNTIGFSSGSAFFNPDGVPVDAIANHWSRSDGISGNYNGQNISFQHGVATAGYGPFGSDNSFGGASGVSPDGVDYGLVSSFTSSLGSLNANKQPFIKNGVEIKIKTTLSDLSSLGDQVWFQFGTSASETGFSSVPEPIFYQLGALLGLGGIGMIRMRRKLTKVA